MNLFIEIASEEKSNSFEIIDINYLHNLNVFHQAVIFASLPAHLEENRLMHFLRSFAGVNA